MLKLIVMCSINVARFSDPTSLKVLGSDKFISQQEKSNLISRCTCHVEFDWRWFEDVL